MYEKKVQKFIIENKLQRFVDQYAFTRGSYLTTPAICIHTSHPFIDKYQICAVLKKSSHKDLTLRWDMPLLTNAISVLKGASNEFPHNIRTS